LQIQSKSKGSCDLGSVLSLLKLCTYAGSIEKVERDAAARVATVEDEAHEAKMAQRILETQLRQLEKERRSFPAHKQAPPKTSPPKKRMFRELDPKVATFQHPDPRLHAQLLTLRDRHQKLSSLLADNPNNLKNLEILDMLEKAIHDIVTRESA